MSNMMAKTEQLDGYGVFLEEKATEFKEITTRMKEIVKALESGWAGTDASNFQANATAYLENIKLIEERMRYYGSQIKGKAAKYNNICASFYDILGS